jgi:hypothetical protein
MQPSSENRNVSGAIRLTAWLMSKTEKISVAAEAGGIVPISV